VALSNQLQHSKMPSARRFPNGLSEACWRLVLASSILVMAGLVGGSAGAAGNWAGGKLFRAGSYGQKLMALDARYEIKA
jgi:hypothetical protein